MTLADDIRSLTRKRRSRPVWEKMSALLDDIADEADSISAFTEAMTEAVSAMGALQEEMDQAQKSAFLPELGTIRAAVTAFLDASGGGEDETAAELAESARALLDDYKAVLCEPAEYSTDQKDDIWEEICDAFGAIAELLDKNSAPSPAPGN
jgi:hypothetical protein